MSIPTEPAAEHRSIAGTFTELVRERPRRRGAPRRRCPGGRRATSSGTCSTGSHRSWPSGADVHLPPGPSVDDDPLAAWEHHARGVQELLDDPAAQSRRFAHPMLPEMPLPQAVSQFYTNDVFMHTWDLARATGQDDRLDEERCRVLYEGMLPLDDVLRQSGQYGPKVPVPDGADWAEQAAGFIGRTPEPAGARP